MALVYKVDEYHMNSTGKYPPLRENTPLVFRHLRSSSEGLHRRRKISDFQLDNSDFLVEIRVDDLDFAKFSACGELHVPKTV